MAKEVSAGCCKCRRGVREVWKTDTIVCCCFVFPSSKANEWKEKQEKKSGKKQLRHGSISFLAKRRYVLSSIEKIPCYRTSLSGGKNWIDQRFCLERERERKVSEYVSWLLCHSLLLSDMTGHEEVRGRHSSIRPIESNAEEPGNAHHTHPGSGEDGVKAIIRSGSWERRERRGWKDLIGRKRVHQRMLFVV